MQAISQTTKAISFAFSILFFAGASQTSQAQIVLGVGRDDNTHLRTSSGGGTNANFMQENGSVNPLPGVPNSPAVDRQADNDYYFSGNYVTPIQSVVDLYGAYAPVGLVTTNENAAERAFVPSDTDLRYHFNLPETLRPSDLLSVSFDALDLHVAGGNPRWGIEIYFNGVLVQPQIVIRPAQLDTDYTSPAFTLASVNAQVGPGFDNIITLKGTHYGSGDWMGIDYVQLNAPTVVIPPGVFPWGVGKDDNGYPAGDGGGTNASFVQGNGTVNSLPGSPSSPEVDGQADNDYYFAGSYTTNISSVVTNYGPYIPVGLVPNNEEAAERALSDNDNELRYHFNLPNSASPATLASVSFDPFELDVSGADPRYGVEVYVNGIRVQQTVIRPAQLGQKFTTLPFRLGDYNARTGPGFDNIITLKAISFSGSGGGTFLGLDYVQLNMETNAVPPATLPWSLGRNDNAWPAGDGGATNASFLEPSGLSNPLPGNPANLEQDFEVDNDYYFAGGYATVIPGNGDYIPVGLVSANEEGVARGLNTDNNETRFHFNLPSSLKSNDVMSFSFEPLRLDESGAPDPRYGIEIYFNGVLIQTQLVFRIAQLSNTFTTARFTAGSVNAKAGPGFDNIIRIKGFSYIDMGGGYSLDFDYFRLNVHLNSPFPWTVGRDDDGWPAGNGGEANTSFVQENGNINPLPGRADNPEVNQQGDNDYYFVGDYTTTIPSVETFYGPYTPIGAVVVNEEGAERAFAGGDRDLRYHFNLPTSLNPDDTLSVTFDANNLDTNPGGGTQPPPTDPRWGVEVYFNGVLVGPQVVIRPAQLGVDYTTPPFTLASVNAQVGPGFDNIISLKGISYLAEGGGNWMGIDYVRLNGPPPPRLLPPVRAGNQIVLNWTGGGALEWAPTVLGPWTPVTPVPTPPYSEAIVSNTNRFFRLKK